MLKDGAHVVAVRGRAHEGDRETDRRQEKELRGLDQPEPDGADVRPRGQRGEAVVRHGDERGELGSQIVMPSELREVLAEHMDFCLRHYTPGPMAGVQREFH